MNAAPTAHRRAYAQVPSRKPPFPTADPKVGWGAFQPGARIHSLSELKVGDLYLVKTCHFSGDRSEWAHNVHEVTALDPLTLGRDIIVSRMIEPSKPTDTRIGSAPGIRTWGYELRYGADSGTALFFKTSLPTKSLAPARTAKVAKAITMGQPLLAV